MSACDIAWAQRVPEPTCVFSTWGFERLGFRAGWGLQTGPEVLVFGAVCFSWPKRRRLFRQLTLLTLNDQHPALLCVHASWEYGIVVLQAYWVLVGKMGIYFLGVI